MNEHEQDRRTKLAAIRASGIDPFPSINEYVCPLEQVRSDWREEMGKDGGHSVVIAGRIMLRRGMGGLSFITLRDSTAEIQVAFDKKRLTPALFALTKNLDLGDLILVEGRLGATQTGEITVWADRFVLSAKTLSPPPSKLEGLRDQELRYRQRHVDLFSNQDSMRTLQMRSRIVQMLRSHLYDNGWFEVETPILQVTPGGATAKPFVTHHNAIDMDLYLRIAPELFLKRLLIGGFQKVFEIGRNFRNEGFSLTHNPEFTAMEGYWAYRDHFYIMDWLEATISHIASATRGGDTKIKNWRSELGEVEIDLAPSWRRATMQELIEEHGPDSWGKKLPPTVEVYEKFVEPKLLQPTFVTGFPSAGIPLAKEAAPGEAAAFELVIAGVEIGCGYSELADPDLQLEHFRQQAGEDRQVLDQDFVDALKCGMPPAGGFGIGLDRLVALLTGQMSIHDVIAFPLMKPKHGG
jgi:lysyl-tRNA synthetase class 2